MLLLNSAYHDLIKFYVLFATEQSLDKKRQGELTQNSQKMRSSGDERDEFSGEIFHEFTDVDKNLRSIVINAVKHGNICGRSEISVCHCLRAVNN
jgi:hypothetical protein